MVELPSVPRRLVLTEAPRNRLTPADIAGPSLALANALGNTGDSLVKIAKDQQDAIDTTIVSKQLDAAQTQAQALAEKAQGDVNVFEKAWQTYARDSLKNVPKKYQAEVEGKLVNIGGGTYRKMFAEAADRTGKIAVDAIDARLGTLTAELTDLARTGKSGSEDYRVRQAEVEDLINQKTQNRLMNYSPEHAKFDREALDDKLIGASVTGQLEDIYAKDGFAAAQKRAQEIYNDSSDGLDKIKKLKAIQEGLKSVRALYAQDTEGRKQFSADRQELTAALADGSIEPDNALVTDMLATADQMHDPLSRLSIISAQAKARLNPMGSMGLHDRLDYLSRLRGTESGGNVNAANPNSSALGPDQFIDSTWLDVIKRNRPDLAAAKSDPELLALRTDPKISGEMTVALARENNAALAAVNLPITPTNTYLAHFLGARGAIRVLNAPPGTPVNQLLGADQIAANKAVLEGKTAGEVRSWASGRMGATVGDNLDGYIKGVLPEVKANIKTGLTDAIAAAKTSLDHDVPIDDSQMRDLVDAARIVDDAGTYDDVQKLFARSAAVVATVGVPVGDQASLIDKLRAPGPVGDEALRLAALDQAEATHKRMADLLDKDPMGLAAQLGLTKGGPPVDFANIAAAPAILASRLPAAKALATAENTGPLSVLRPSEADALAASWNGADANKKLAIVGSLTQALPADTLMATLAKFADKDDTRSLAVAGALAKVNPEVGAAVIRGNEALKANPKFAFGNDAPEYLQARDSYFPSTVVAPVMTAAWQAHIEAARAVYADASAQAGDTSGTFKEDRWQSAITAVTGGILEQGNGKIIAPRPDINQSKFDAVMAGLPEAAFAGAVTPDGTPLTGRFIRSQGTLQSYGDGRYVVELGGTGAYALRAPRSPSEAGIGGPFVLDLRPWLDVSFKPLANVPGIDAARQLSGQRGNIGLFGY